jgi:inner membrane protein
MDNLCHTLAGAALAEAGLKARTRYAGATLMLSANLPDLDVLVFATGVPALAFRRGWTHGVLAQLLLPVALTGLVWLVGRYRPARADGPPLHPGWLLALSYIGVASHVFLDFLNTYGIRLLAPLDWRWFYGDAVFIIDPWLWLALGGGVALARRQRAPAAARVALALTAAYIGLMLASMAAAREAVAADWEAREGTPPQALMVGPVPAWPFRRDVIIDAGEYYQVGSYDWWPGTLVLEPTRIPKDAERREVARAVQQSPGVRAFLVWSRFPFWETAVTENGIRVTVFDVRFMANGVRFAASTTLAPEPPHGP